LAILVEFYRAHGRTKSLTALRLTLKRAKAGVAQSGRR